VADPVASVGLGHIVPVSEKNKERRTKRSTSARRQNTLLHLEGDEVYPCRAEGRESWFN